MVFNTLVNNIALLLTLSLLYNLINRKWDIKSKYHKILSGILFGFFTIIGMMNSLKLMPGIIFDGRSIIISIAGLFGGPVTALITVIISAAYRLYLGGGGALMGVSVITSSALVGVWFHHLRKRNEIIVKPFNLWLFSLIVHVIMLVLTVALPSNVSFDVFKIIAIPVLVIYPIGSVLICLLFLNNEQIGRYLKELTKSEANYRALYENANDAILILKGDVVIDCNTQAEHLFGCEKKLLVNKQIRELSPVNQPDGKTSDMKGRSYIGEAYTGKGQRFEWIHKKISGEDIYTEVSLNLVKLEDGEYLLALLHDIEDRKKQEAEIQKISQMLHVALEATESSAFENNFITGEVVNTPAAYIRMGYSVEEIPTNIEDLKKLVHPDDIPGVFANIEAHLKGDTPFYNAEFRMKDKSGTYRWLNGRGKIVEKDAEGNAVKLIGLSMEITDFKLAQDAMKESERKFRSYIQNAPAAIFVTNAKGEYIRVNPIACSYTGYSEEELLKMKISDLVAPEDHEKAYRHFVTASTYGKVSGEFTFIRKNGSRFYILVDAVRISENSILAFCLDITENKLALEALRESEERLRTLINIMPDIVCFKDSEGRWLEANDFDLELFGLKGVDYRGKKDSDLAPYSDFYREAFLNCEATDEETWRKGVISRCDEVIPRPDGKPRTFDVIKVPTFYPDGRRKGLVVVGRDITDRIQNEMQLRKLYYAVEQSPASIVITDLNGNIEYVNRKFTEMTGYHTEDVIGQKEIIFRRDGIEDVSYDAIQDCLKKDNEWKGIYRNRRKDEEYYWESAYVSSIRNADNVITNWIAVKEDITHNKLLQEELVKAKDKAEASDRLKGEFLAQMSHEIRTPVNAILSFSSLISEELNTQITGDLATSFTIIKRAGERIIRTIDLILNMSEIQTGTYEANFTMFDIRKECLNILFEEFKVMASERGLQLSLNPATEDCLLYADQYTVNQIFNNLVHNAIKYTSKGKIDINLFRDMSHSLVVEIADTGIGISKEYLPYLFSPFSQEEQGYTRKFEGNGLGLALVKRYCEVNDAEIMVESEKGKGTRFAVKFKNPFNKI